MGRGTRNLSLRPSTHMAPGVGVVRSHQIAGEPVTHSADFVASPETIAIARQVDGYESSRSCDASALALPS